MQNKFLYTNKSFILYELIMDNHDYS